MRLSYMKQAGLLYKMIKKLASRADVTAVEASFCFRLAFLPVLQMHFTDLIF